MRHVLSERSQKILEVMDKAIETGDFFVPGIIQASRREMVVAGITVRRSGSTYDDSYELFYRGGRVSVPMKKFGQVFDPNDEGYQFNKEIDELFDLVRNSSSDDFERHIDSYLLSGGKGPTTTVDDGN